VELRYALAVVTGAGAGLGREVAVAMARRGTAVLVADRDPAAAEEAAGLVREQRVGGWAFPADVTEEADLRALADRARDLGGADVLVNNAGGWTAGDQYPAAPYDAWSRTLDLNLRAPMLLTQLFLEGLDQRRGPRRVGAVVNVASSAAVGTDGYGSPEYAAAKAGLIRFTTALGTPPGVRINCVVPGWILTERAVEELKAMTVEQRAAAPRAIPMEDVAAAVVRLVQDDALDHHVLSVT
jgi:NAD(P)-dependent dehydrogenase (short-subunit alcohol dehydrogenase family)